VRKLGIIALAVMGHKRVAALKDVPTIMEAGYPKLAGRGLERP
jgi:tripartite-type tricarboxylate transporter receptor subunit TctC